MTSDVYEVTVHRPYAFLEQQCHEMFRFQICDVVVHSTSCADVKFALSTVS